MPSDGFERDHFPGPNPDYDRGTAGHSTTGNTSILWKIRTDIHQRRGSILAWMVILSVYGADTIAIDLSLSALISWFMKSIIGLLNNSNLHAIISTLLIFNLQWVKKNYFAVLEEIYNNVVLHWSAVLISCNHLITRLFSFTKNSSNRRSILSVYGPWALTPFTFPDPLSCLSFWEKRL